MKVKIDRLGINGEGICKISEGVDEGKIAFVDFALPEEVVEIDIEKSKSKYCLAKLKNILKISQERIEPPCPYFANCGGCDIQHLKNSAQITFKKKKVFDVIRKIDDKFDELDFCQKKQFGYRNKMVFPFSYENDNLKLGMFKKNSHEVVEIDKCLLTSENINKILRISRDYFYKNVNKFVKNNKCLLKYLVTREYNNNFLVAIVCAQKIDLEDYFKVLSSNFENIGLSTIISNSEDEILSGEYNHLFGLKSINIEEFGIRYNIDIMSFLQINNEIKREIYSKVLDFIESGDRVIDAYSGAGLLSAIISKKASSVVGIEINRFANARANELTKINNITNLKNICADTGKVLKDWCKEMPNCVLVLDPARNGCGKEVLSFLGENTENIPKKILYISCNLSTLARDLEVLKNNYKILNASAFDMFVQTKHIETLVCLQRQV